MLAVLTVVGFTSRMENDAKRIAIEATTQAAQQISLGMGAPSEGIEAGIS
jgi:DNA-binding IclR family transcriptional regulator